MINSKKKYQGTLETFLKDLLSIFQRNNSNKKAKETLLKVFILSIGNIILRLHITCFSKNIYIQDFESGIRREKKTKKIREWVDRKNSETIWFHFS